MIQRSLAVPVPAQPQPDSSENELLEPLLRSARGEINTTRVSYISRCLSSSRCQWACTRQRHVAVARFRCGLHDASIIGFVEGWPLDVGTERTDAAPQADHEPNTAIPRPFYRRRQLRIDIL
jgi:hypothetical protein